MCFYLHFFFFVRFDDCYLRANLFAEHPVFIPRSSVLISLIASRRSLPRRRDAGILSHTHESVSRAFPRTQHARTVGRRLDQIGGWGGQENGRRDARRRAPAVLDSGQRPRCLSGEMAEKGNRARGWGCLPTTYISEVLRTSTSRRKKGPL